MKHLDRDKERKRKWDRQKERDGKSDCFCVGKREIKCANDRVIKNVEKEWSMKGKSEKLSVKDKKLKGQYKDNKSDKQTQR